MNALLRRLRTEMNGAVVESMERQGIRYPLNYGVSVPTIRTVSGAYAGDHELALLLFEQPVRELKLAALFIDDPARVTTTQLQRWGHSFTNSEIAGQAALHLISKAPCGLEVSREWIFGPDAWLRYTGLLAASWIVRRSVQSPNAGAGETAFAPLLDIMQNSISSYPVDEVTSGAVIALSIALGQVSPVFSREISAFAIRLTGADHPILRHTGSEIAALIEES